MQKQSYIAKADDSIWQKQVKYMGKKCVGLIEARGLAAAIEAADTAVKIRQRQIIRI